MNKDYTAQILDSNPGATNAQAFLPQIDYFLDEKQGKGEKSKHAKKLKKRIKELETQQQLLALALWECQSSLSATESPKKKKKKKKGKKGKNNKQPEWLDQVLVQTLPTIITESFDRMLPPSQSQPVLALPDGRDYKH